MIIVSILLDTSQPEFIIGTTKAHRTTDPSAAAGVGGADEDDFHILKRLNAEVDSEERALARKAAKSRKEGVGAVGAVTQKPFREFGLAQERMKAQVKAKTQVKRAKVVNF